MTGSEIASATASDYVTIKYDTHGGEEWIARYSYGGSSVDSYDRAHALAVDNLGNVYVTGMSGGSDAGDYDYAAYGTVKYNSAGVEEWVARHNESGSDRPIALAVDGLGNVYVTGTNRTSTGYLTVKYDAAGVEQWTAQYHGEEGDDDPVAIAVDDYGSVYVTGTTGFIRTWWNFDYATVKYDSAGNQEWVARYNGPENDLDFATGIAIISSGVKPVAKVSTPGVDLYVTGWSLGSGTAFDFATVKYDSKTGEQLWVARYDAPSNHYDFDRANAITLDGSGNAYVAGESWSGSGSFCATIKYNSAGVQQWAARYAGDGDDRPVAIAADTSGNVYVTGASSSGASFDYDYTTVKYNSAGVLQWVARYGGPGNGWDQPYALALDAAGNIHVTGQATGWNPENNADFVTVKYNSQGRQQWIARYSGPRNSQDVANAIAVDEAGRVYVTGYSADYGPAWNIEMPIWGVYTTIKYEQIPAPILTSSRQMLDFGIVQAGSSKKDSLRISNWGSVPLVILSAVSDQPSFHIAPAAAAVEPDSTVTFYITFLPTSRGEKTANIIFHHNGLTSSDTVYLRGTGVQAAFAATPQTLAFGQVPLGLSSQKAIRVTNSGDAVLVVDSVESDNQHFMLLSGGEAGPTTPF